MERDLARVVALGLAAMARSLASWEALPLSERCEMAAIADALYAALEERSDDPAERRDYDG